MCVSIVSANMAAQEVERERKRESGREGAGEHRLEAQNVEIVLCCVMITTMRTFAQFLI